MRGAWDRPPNKNGRAAVPGGADRASGGRGATILFIARLGAGGGRKGLRGNPKGYQLAFNGKVRAARTFNALPGQNRGRGLAGSSPAGGGLGHTQGIGTSRVGLPTRGAGPFLPKGKKKKNRERPAEIPTGPVLGGGGGGKNVGGAEMGGNGRLGGGKKKEGWRMVGQVGGPSPPSSNKKKTAGERLPSAGPMGLPI